MAGTASHTAWLVRHELWRKLTAPNKRCREQDLNLHSLSATRP